MASPNPLGACSQRYCTRAECKKDSSTRTNNNDKNNNEDDSDCLFDYEKFKAEM